MKKNLQMLHEFIPDKGLTLKKYLFAFCMLFGVQQLFYAQTLTPDPGISAGSETAKYCDPNVTSLSVSGDLLPYSDGYVMSPMNLDYVYHVKQGGSVKLSVSSFTPTTVKWEMKTSKLGDWKYVTELSSTVPLEVDDITHDVLFRATFENSSPFGGGGTTDQRALLAVGTLVPDMKKACPSEAVQLDIHGGEFAYRSEWQLGYGPGATTKVKEYADGTSIYTINASTQPLKGYVILKYDQYNCSKSSTSPRFRTDNINVEVETDCKKECQSTTTGEYYVGTGFDPVDGECNPGGKIPGDVYHFFDDYQIIFEENSDQFSQKVGNWDQKEGNKYWLGCNAEEFFGQVPDMDAAAGKVGKNNYLFAQGNINANLFKLKFQVWDDKPNKGWTGVRGKAYQYKMRAYIQLDEGCSGEKWANAQFLARTEHGNQTWDITEVTAYDNKTSKMLGTKTIYGPNDAVLLKDVIGQEYLNNMTGFDLVRFEVVFYGSFPMTQNSLNYFVFEPRFQQFECAKVAIDYISAEIENVCLSPNVVCVGESTKANAAGYPKDSHFQWFREVSPGTWELLEEGGDDKSIVNLPVTKIGKQKFKLNVTGVTYVENGKPQPFEREQVFSVGGKNCDAQPPTAIDGSGVFCLPNVYGYKPNLIDDDPEVTYKWNLLDPDGTLLYKSDLADPHFYTYTSKGDSLIIKLDENTKEGEYTLEVETYSASLKQGNTISMPLSVYRTPQISLVLSSDKFNDVSNEEDKELCASDVRREIVAVAKNAFDSPASSMYNYFWISDPNGAGVLIPRMSGDSADVHAEAIPGSCEGVTKSVKLSVRADIKGCSSTDTNEYPISAGDDPTIDCSSLIGTKDTFYLPKKKETTEIRIPIPTFTSGCDSDPDLIIEYTPLRDEVRDTMGVTTLVVRKSQIDTIKSLSVTLPWGEYKFQYTVKDGCGRTESCVANIVIKKDYYPDVPCDQIKDLDVINGAYNNDQSSKCSVKFNSVDLTIPRLPDLSYEKDTLLTGKYLGRRHFDTPQDKDILKGSPESLAEFDKTIGLYDEYEVEYTYILWGFTNNAEKTSYCVQEVLVRDTMEPAFDCAQIENPFRPETKSGECEIKFKDFWPTLKAKNYIAWDSCPKLQPVYGELHEDSLNKTSISDTRVFKVGIEDTVYWQFRDPHSYGDVVKFCPQIINAKSSDSVVVDCDALEYFEGVADSGTCYVDAKKLNIPMPPYGTEPCLDKDGKEIKVPGVGTRSDGKALDDPYPTGDTYINWLFVGENSYPSTCKTHVHVKGNKKPDVNCELLFPKRWISMPNCDPMEVQLEPKPVPDPCVAGYMITSEPYIVNGTDSTKIDLVHTFNIGETFVTWMFWDYTHSVSAFCKQSIHLRNDSLPDVLCDTLRDSEMILDGVCEIPYASFRDSLGEKVALEHCTKDTIWGVPYLYDPVTNQIYDFPDPVKVDIYNIRWVFANDSLTTAQATCDKMLYVKSNIAPPIDCNSSMFKDLQLFDTVGMCKIDLTPDNLPLPSTHDACKVDYVVYGHGYVQLFEEGEFQELCYFDRIANKEVYLMDLPLGGHKIKWVFESPYSSEKDSCSQIVKANSSALDSINCEDLATYVTVTLRTSGEGATFEEVRDSGLIVPSFWDPCLVIDTIYTRNDGKSIYDIYPVNSIVEITWTFLDTTNNANRKKICNTTVEVTDGATPICVSPKLVGEFSCKEAIPAPYATWSDFKNAGGKLVSNGVDVSDLVYESTFKCDTTILGDKCDYTFIRSYYITNLRDSISVCKQQVQIRDTVAPVWLDNAASTTKIFDCKAVDFYPTGLRASDECSNNIFTEHLKVNELNNLKDGIFYTSSSTQSSNPADCDYYKYEIVYRFVAVDGCSNQSSVLEYVAKVDDIYPPVVNMPDTASWRTAFVPANYAYRGCEFTYPDLVSSFPKDSISDVCDPAAAKYFKITQTPEAGTVIENPRIPQYVTLHITDPCGLEDTLMKRIQVQNPDSIVHLTLDDTVVCAGKNVSLNSLKIVSGSIWEENWFKPGVYDTIQNKKIEFDFYYGEVKEENLIYSNNHLTYSNKYDQILGPNYYTSFKSMSQTGLYTIVAMDTALHCVDTASAYITVHDKPYISLYDSSYVLCERDSIRLTSDGQSLSDKYHLSVSDNGEEITEEGWMLNGVKYVPETTVDYMDGIVRMQYYAVNACGTGESSDWISLSMKQRMKSDNLMLVTDPNNPPRVFQNESATLTLVSDYEPAAYMWYRVKGTVDGISDEMFDKYGNVLDDYVDFDFEQDSLLDITYLDDVNSNIKELTQLGDSAKYYVLLVDDVCPAVPSNVVAIDVVKKLPTAFTPHNSVGMNDIFMEGHKVIIFNRYGQKMTESDNGWDGTCRGALVDPGVYFYEVIINNGQKHKGSIEVVYFK